MHIVKVLFTRVVINNVFVFIGVVEGVSVEG